MNREGFSLLGTLVAMGATTTLLVGLSSVLTVSSKYSRTVDNQHRFEEIRNILNHIVEDSTLCGEALRGQFLDSENVELTSDFIVPDGKISIGSKVGGWVVSEASFETVRRYAVRSFMAVLRFRLDQAVSPQELQHSEAKRSLATYGDSVKEIRLSFRGVHDDDDAIERCMSNGPGRMVYLDPPRLVGSWSIGSDRFTPYRVETLGIPDYARELLITTTCHQAKIYLNDARYNPGILSSPGDTTRPYQSPACGEFKGDGIQSGETLVPILDGKIYIRKMRTRRGGLSSRNTARVVIKGYR